MGNYAKFVETIFTKPENPPVLTGGVQAPTPGPVKGFPKVTGTVHRVAVDTASKAMVNQEDEDAKQTSEDMIKLANKVADMNVDEKMVWNDQYFENITDSERIQYIATEQAESLSSYEAAGKNNVLNTWSGLLSKDADKARVEKDWVLGDRAKWFATEKLAMDENLRVWWEENPENLPTNYNAALQLTSDYAEYKALANRTYHKPGMLGIVEGFYNDMVTSFASPQELALTAATLGVSKLVNTPAKIEKAREAYILRSKLNNQVRRYGGSMLLSSAFALSAEEMRQTFLGIDLQNEDTMLMIGAAFGLGLRGIGDTYVGIRNKIQGMPKAEQKKVLDEIAARIRAKEAEKTMIITDNPIGTPKLSVPAHKNNPSPILRLYNIGEESIYNVISKIGKSSNTLLDSKGNAVAQGETAQEIYKRKYVGAHNILISNMEHYADQLGLTIKQFTDTVQKSFDARSLVLRERKADLEVLNGRLIGAKESITKATKEKDAKSLLAAKAVLQETEAEIKRIGDVPSIDTGTKEVDGALHSMEDFFSTYNVENYKLRLRDLQKEQKYALDLYNKKRDTKTEKLEEQLALSKFVLINKQAAARLNAKENAPDTLKALDIKQSKELAALEKKEAKSRTSNAERVEAKKAAFNAKQEKELSDLEVLFKDGHLGYFPRYFNADSFTFTQSLAQRAAQKIRRNPSDKDFIVKNKEHKATLRGKLILALQNSPTAKSLSKYDPIAYREYMDSVEGVADSMIDNVGLAKTQNELRDLTTMTSTGQSNKLRSKSDIGRRIDVDESFIRDYTHSDWATVTQAYSYDMGHKLSMRESLGVSNMEEFTEKFMDPILSGLGKSGKYSRTELKEITANLETVFQTGVGTRALRKDDGAVQDYMRAVMSMSNAVFSSGFGVTTLPEAGPVTAAGGFKIYEQTIPMIKQVLRDYSKKGYDENTADFLKGIGIAGNIQNSVIESRVAEGTFHAFDQGASLVQKLEQGGRKVANVGYHAGMFHSLTSFFKYSAAGGFQARTHRLGQKLLDGGTLGAGNIKYFSRQGLTLDDMKAISQQPLKDKDGNPNYKMEGWDATLREKTITAMRRASDEAVLEPTSLDLPRISTRGDTTSSGFNMFFQYTRFPLAAYNMLVRNGYDDMDAKHTASLMTASAIAVTSLLLQEEYAVATGSKKDYERRYYDITGNLDYNRIFVDMSNKLGQFTVVGKGLDIGSALTGKENPASGYTNKVGTTMQGPALSIAGQVHDIATGEPGTAYSNLLNLVPVISRHPITRPFMEDWSGK